MVKIYPRRDQISDDYTGCQTAWGYHSDNWHKLVVMYFENGELHTVLDVPTQELCEYRASRLMAGDPKHCAKIESGNNTFPSFAPECLTGAIARGAMSDECRNSFDDPTQAPSRAADYPP